jgi:hypothetical protein
MPNPKTIREYLVGLGFAVDKPAWRKFEDTMKVSGYAVEKFAGTMAKDFTIAGGVAVTALATITGATIGIMKSVADQDLRYQVLARRMFMTTEATKKMTMATDALGYSLEEIIWGPPELAERYRQLIKDQTEMFKFLGSDGGEKAFKSIRDFGFQVTRVGLGLKVFGMVLTKDIIQKLIGTHSMEDALKTVTGWVDTFQHNVGPLADKLSDVLAPALKAVWDMGKEVFTDKNVKWAVDMTVTAAGWVKDFFELLDKSPEARSIFLGSAVGAATEAAGGAAIGAVGGAALLGPVGAAIGTPAGAVMGGVSGAIHGAVGGEIYYRSKKYGSDWTTWAHQNLFKKWAVDSAKKYSLDPYDFLAMLSIESGTKYGLNPNAYNPSSGAAGIGQFMPYTAKQYHLDNLYDPQASIEASAHYMHDLMEQYGTFDAARKVYAGYKKKDPSKDLNELHRRSNLLRKGVGDPTKVDSGATIQPQSYKIEINVAPGNAAGKEMHEHVKKAVVEAIEYHERKKAQDSFAYRQGVFA